MKTTIQAVLQEAQDQLLSYSETPTLDAELLLAKTLGVDRVFLKTHPDQRLSESQMASFCQDVRARALGKPVAYLLGHKAFWTFDLLVNEQVLVPRPETECVIEAVLAACPEPRLPYPIVDLGTGSGAIALALAVERPAWKIIAVEQSQAAMRVARSNAERILGKNQTQVTFYVGDWLSPIEVLGPFSGIVSNPPYLSETDPHLQSPELQHEPRQALVSGVSGLEAYQIILKQAQAHLSPEGILCLEHGHDQQSVLLSLMKRLGFRACCGKRDFSGVPRVVIAKK